jgi:hypothetical protein
VSIAVLERMFAALEERGVEAAIGARGAAR